ncbi:MAG: DsbE family thiol:disulfide interchange protein [Pseudomonadota bacterium]|nr:DsbE family thiol:disulfide interchange protein [Pseudomonadota bacterium]
MAKFLIPLAIFAVLAIFLGRGLSLDPREVPSPLIDKPAPTFSLARLDQPGQMIGTEQLRGQVWILNVWASWCVACRDEHPVLVEFAKSGVAPIYGLNYKDKREPAMNWLQQLGNPYTASIFDESGRVGIDFGVYGVPETFVIDKAGVIRYKKTGPVTPETIQSTILPLVKKLQG